jgi:hypothetical protein
MIDGRRFVAGPFELEALLEKNRVAVASMVRTKDFVGFDPRLPRGQDWDAWLRMLKCGKSAVKVPVTLFQVCTDRVGRISHSVTRNRYLSIMRRHHQELGRVCPDDACKRTIVTAIVVYQNSQPWFQVTLNSLLRRSFTRNPEQTHLRVLLIENPCLDDSPAAARRFVQAYGKNSRIFKSGLPARVRHVADKHAHGLEAGYGKVKQDSEWTLFLDADIVLLKDFWLDDLLDRVADMVGPPAFAHLKDTSIPHAHPCFLLFRTKLARAPYWKGGFRFDPKPPDGSKYWDTAK